MTPNELDELLQSSFDFNIPQSKKVAYIILVDGQRVKTRSNKYVWNGLGAAKSALTNHLYDCTSGRRGPDYNAFQLKLNDWVEKHVVFMPLIEFELNMQNLQRNRSGQE
jgi:hypothetical protein